LLVCSIEFSGLFLLVLPYSTTFLDESPDKAGLFTVPVASKASAGSGFCIFCRALYIALVHELRPGLFVSLGVL
jgi:hypothetical protein